jgi:hypothetical protein
MVVGDGRGYGCSSLGGHVIDGASSRDMDLGFPELSVVEEERGLSGSEKLSVVCMVEAVVVDLTYDPFSKVTVADLVASASEDSGVTEMEVILPLK